MSDLNTTEYYRGREQQERVLQGTAASPAIAAVHRELADRYAELAGQSDLEPQTRLQPELRA